MRKLIARHLLPVLIGLMGLHAQAMLGTPAVISCSQVHSKSQQSHYAYLASSHRYPENLAENSSAQLFDSVAGFYERFSPQFTDLGRNIFEWKGPQLILNSRIPDQYQGMVLLQATLEKALEKTGLTLSAALHLGFAAQRALAEAEGLSWTEYVSDMSNFTIAKYTRANLLEAEKEMLMNLEMDHRFQIPYLAGYAVDNARKIYIDSGVKNSYTLADGQEIDVIPFLMIHEGVEKALLDFVQLKNKPYLRTHQIAQRIEKALVEAAGYKWSDYQADLMQTEIARADHQKLTLTPADLDKIPYVEWEDTTALTELSRTAQNLGPKNKGIFELKTIRPGIFFLHFKDQRTLARTMIRFQEFYESPKFRGQSFTRSEFQRWYREKKGVFNYYSEWDGFNVPKTIIDAFANGQFKNITSEEQEVLNAFKLRGHSDYYVIATADDSGVNTLNHEIAHGMYYLNPKYKAEVVAVLSTIDTTAVKKYLHDTVGDYHDAVLDDEVHAWLMHDTPWMAEHGFDISPYKDITAQLKSIFEKYSH